MALTLRGHMAADWHTCTEQRASQLREGTGRAEGPFRGRAQERYMCCSSGDMSREDHYYPAQVFKESCAYQRSQAEDYSHTPPPCLYMSRQAHPVYTPPAMGALEQTNLSDIVPSYSLPMREDQSAPQLHHPLGLQQQPVPPAAGYSDTGEQSRYPLPFPWMKTTKSHSHTWKGQWTGNYS